MSVTLKTNFGELKVELFCEQAPKAAKNFLALAAAGYYTGTRFHRSIKGFMVQGGDLTGTGKGGTSIYGKTFADEVEDSLRHDRRGVVSMANKGKPDTNGSQFFITYAAHSHLDNLHTVFGQVIHGLETLDGMEKVPVDKKYRPQTDIVIEDVEIHANPFAQQESDVS